MLRNGDDVDMSPAARPRKKGRNLLLVLEAAVQGEFEHRVAGLFELRQEIGRLGAKVAQSVWPQFEDDEGLRGGNQTLRTLQDAQLATLRVDLDHVRRAQPFDIIQGSLLNLHRA